MGSLRLLMWTVLLCTVCSFRVYAQIKQPVKWHFAVSNLKDNEFELILTANVEEGWHIYAQDLPEGGPLPTSITFEPSPSYELIGPMKEESQKVEKFDPTFLIPVAWFEKTAVFTQKLRLKSASAVMKWKVEFMACSEYECLLPEEKEFAATLNAKSSQKGKEPGVRSNKSGK